MYKVIHNPRCSKSRESLNILEKHLADYQLIHYLDGQLTLDLLNEVLSALNLAPRDVIRLNEDSYKALSINLDNDELVKKAILAHPQILQRPLIWKGDNGVIGRPPENVLKILE
jgi:arsenate reductase (glutaredoxin)